MTSGQIKQMIANTYLRRIHDGSTREDWASGPTYCFASGEVSHQCNEKSSVVGRLFHAIQHCKVYWSYQGEALICRPRELCGMEVYRSWIKSQPNSVQCAGR